jgi:hypothetical protein
MIPSFSPSTLMTPLSTATTLPTKVEKGCAEVIAAPMVKRIIEMINAVIHFLQIFLIAPPPSFFQLPAAKQMGIEVKLPNLKGNLNKNY